MKKVLMNTLITVLVAMVLVFVGCRSLVDEFTPANIPDRAIGYIGDDNPASDTGRIPSLADAGRIKDEIVIEHRENQTGLLRAAQDDKTKYKDAIGFIDVAIAEANQLQELVVGSVDNPFSILGLLAPLGVGTLLGKQYLRRPDDYTPEEVDALIAEESKKENAGSESN